MNTDKKSPTSSQSAELTCYAAMNEAQRSEDSTLTDLLCVVSPHEKGFWQADVYFYGWDEGIPPDWFCTGKRGGTKEEIINMVIERYPSARIVMGYLEYALIAARNILKLKHIVIVGRWPMKLKSDLSKCKKGDWVCSAKHGWEKITYIDSGDGRQRKSSVQRRHLPML